MPESRVSRCSATRIERPDAFALATKTVISAMEGISRLLVGSSSGRFGGRRAQMLA